MKIINSLTHKAVGLNLLCFVLLSYGPAPKAEPVSSEDTAVETSTPEPQFRSLFFDPALNGVELQSQSVDYDVVSADRIRIGPYELSGDDIALELTREKTEFEDLSFGLQYEKRPGSIYVLSFKWPIDYLKSGRLELLNDQSKTLWRKEITDEEVDKWDSLLKTYEGAPKHKGSHFGLIGKNLLTIPLWKIKAPFRFCLTNDSDEGRLALCSRRYKFVNNIGRYGLEVVSKGVRPRVKVNNKPATLKGSAFFLESALPIKFAALLSSGTYFEFVSSPKDVHIVDLIQTADGSHIEAIGYGHKPMGNVQNLEINQEGFLGFLNFMPSIGDFREFWRVRFPMEEPFLFFKGKAGVPFRQSFLFEKLPSEHFRPKIDKSTLASTYARTPVVRGQVNSSVNVKSEQLSAQKTSDVDFEWEYLADSRGEVHRSLLLLEGQGEVWKAYHEMERGYPREVGLRLTGVVSNELELIFLGEVATQWWFESLLGWENTLLSRQRWGVAAKYFQAFASMGGNKEAENTSLLKLQVSTVDLKYRLTPGIWNKDPTIGIMANVQSVVFEEFEANMGGAGMFWARSMPSFLDRWFSLLPGFDYPKWVDAEVIWYPYSFSPQVQLGANLTVNFHGKIQWTKQFYGEAGFGLKSFVIKDLELRKKAGLGVAYGTVGLGYNF